MSSPINICRVGKARASIFRNSCGSGRRQFEIVKVALDIQFKDKRTGKWRSSRSMTKAELPQAIMALQKALEWIIQEGKQKSPKSIYT